MNSDGRANRAKPSDVPPEFHQIGMAYDAIAYVDRESVGEIAASTLREKDEIPRTIECGSGLGSRCQSETRTACEARD